MPPMERERHEELLNELLLPDIEQSRKTEILQSLRADYSVVLSDFDELTNTKTKLEKDNADLVISNSKLFRQIGVTGTKEEEKVKDKERSETITIEELEKR